MPSYLYHNRSYAISISNPFDVLKPASGYELFMLQVQDIDIMDVSTMRDPFLYWRQNIHKDTSCFQCRQVVGSGKHKTEEFGRFVMLNRPDLQ